MPNDWFLIPLYGCAQLFARHPIAITIQRLDATLSQVILRFFTRGHFRTMLFVAAAGVRCRGTARRAATGMLFTPFPWRGRVVLCPQAARRLSGFVLQGDQRLVAVKWVSQGLAACRQSRKVGICPRKGDAGGCPAALPPPYRSPCHATADLFGIHVPVSYTHLRAHETRHELVCRL